MCLAFALLIAVSLVLSGLVLWLPASGGDSTANSDLGLAFLSGGLALGTGAGVSIVLFVAERGVDLAVRESDARSNLQQVLATAGDLRGIDLRHRDLRGIVLNGQDLSRADLSGADLSNALLYDADLSEANLAGADLRGANLRGAQLRGADLRDVVLDSMTAWPQGFDPFESGASTE